MKKITMALVAGCMTVAVAGAYAATGSPADTDKAGRTGPGTAASEMGAANPSGASPAKGSTKGGSSTGASTTGSGAASSGTGASSTAGSSGASATTGGGTDDTKGSRRARRASKG